MKRMHALFSQTATVRRHLLAVVIALMVVIPLSELVRRVLDGFVLWESFLVVVPDRQWATPLSEAKTRNQDDMVEKITFAKGVSKKLFSDIPEPWPTLAVDPQLMVRSRRYPNHIFWSNAVINRAYLKQIYSKKSFFGGAYPENLFYFSTPDHKIIPKYRLYPGVTLPDGMRLNRYGWREPPPPLNKPPKTVRLAALGDSTSSHQAGIKITYIRLVAHWLNRIAKQRHWDLSFDYINSGRQTLRSDDVRAIAITEVAPFEPDYLIFYGLGNQIDFKSTIRPLENVQKKTKDAFDTDQDSFFTHTLTSIFKPLESRSALARWLLLRWGSAAWRGKMAYEPKKPSQEFVLPFGMDENNPDPYALGMLEKLRRTLQDLEKIKENSQIFSGRLVLSSFKLLAHVGMVLDLSRHRGIYTYLNKFYYPFSYKNINRTVKLHNRIYARWAEMHKVPFLDVATKIPDDPDLFIDVMHNNQMGVRVRAWITFQEILPIIEQDIAQGRIPQPDRFFLKEHPIDFKPKYGKTKEIAETL
ncbi:hypothetical protein ACQZV8_07055 [Magnetococcales bacterium HHB-1]